MQRATESFYDELDEDGEDSYEEPNQEEQRE
jgi:hypothetical protein